MIREIVLDVETTGLNAKNGDKIVEIACMELMDHKPSGRVFHRYINPGRDIPYVVTKIHGIKNRDVADKPYFGEICDELLEFIGFDPVIIHNAGFDIGFINAEMNLTELRSSPQGVQLRCASSKQFIFQNIVIDTLLLARQKFKSGKFSLDALCKKYKISLDDRKYHGAMVDCQLLAKVYLKLLDRDQISLDLLNIVMTDEVKNPTKIRDKKHRPKREFPISAEEERLHAEFVKENIKDAMWGMV